MKNFLLVFLGVVLGLLACWFIRIKPTEVAHTQQVAALIEQARAHKDSATMAHLQANSLTGEVAYWKARTRDHMFEIERLKSTQQQAETDIVELSPTETTKYFDLIVKNERETVLHGDTALTSLEGIREANRLFVVLDYTLQASTLKTAVIASQDSTIKKLEGVNYHRGIENQQQAKVIEKQDGIITSYEGIIADCQRRKKIEAFGRWVLIGGVLVLLLR